jgi:hypothetical protein
MTTDPGDNSNSISSTILAVVTEIQKNVEKLSNQMVIVVDNLDSTNTHLNALDGQIGYMGGQILAIAGMYGKLSQRFDTLEANMITGFAGLREHVTQTMLHHVELYHNPDPNE